MRPSESQAEEPQARCDWFFVNGRWYCKDCLSYKASAERPSARKCPGHCRALRNLFLNPQGHVLQALWIGEGQRPAIFCTKCTRWCYTRPVKLAEACRPPQTDSQRRALRDSKQRVSRGLHPHCSVGDKIVARAPIVSGVAHLDWAGQLEQPG